MFKKTALGAQKYFDKLFESVFRKADIPLQFYKFPIDSS